MIKRFLPRFLRYHEHDPITCEQCSSKQLPEILPTMPYEQRELLDALRVQIDLGLTDHAKAIAQYNNRKQKGWL